MADDLLLDSSDDDFWEAVEDYLDVARVPRPRIFRDRTDPFSMYNDEEFRMRFRLPKHCCVTLLATIGDELVVADRTGSLLPITQLMVTLRFYCTGSFQMAAADLMGVSASTACRVIHKVSYAIGNLARDLVTFPTSPEDRRSTMHDFYQLASFPGVLGAIDCTHVAIQSPGGINGEIYRNRKGYFSLNVQGVVSATLLFENVVSRWPGSSHDAMIFARSRLCSRFESGAISDAYLVGDAGYPSKPYLLTPLATVTTPAQNKYQSAQVQTRNPVERAFGVLKRRFPCLRMGLRVKIQRAGTIVVACVVLHNICLRNGDRLPPDDAPLTMGRRVYEDIPTRRQLNIGPAAGSATRTALINTHFARR